MNSREIMKRAVEFRSPPRVGLIFPKLTDVDYAFDFFQKEAVMEYFLSHPLAADTDKERRA